VDSGTRDGPTDAGGPGEIDVELGADRILRVHLGGTWQLSPRGWTRAA
jgi:hypothetical protein